MNSASLCSLAGRYDNPIPPRFLAPIDCLKIPAQLICSYRPASWGAGSRAGSPVSKCVSLDLNTGWAENPTGAGCAEAWEGGRQLLRLRGRGQGRQGRPQDRAGEAEGPAGLHQGDHPQDARARGEGQTEVSL